MFGKDRESAQQVVIGVIGGVVAVFFVIAFVALAITILGPRIHK